jgi:dTDP-4-dehydrorhamnose reductase
VDTILISGIETVVGANLAATLVDHFRVVGVMANGASSSSSSACCPIAVSGCEVLPEAAHHSLEHLRGLVASVRPQWLIHCGAAAQSTWETPPPSLLTVQLVQAARNWAAVAAEFQCRLTVISSDAVFSGPWMFHREECSCLCPSEPARAIRSMEQIVAEHCPEALVVRTNAYGWSPAASADGGWLERTLARLEDGNAASFDCLAHGTPILASDLAQMIEQAYRAGLSGTYHIAGAERINPARFAERLAEVFGHRSPRSAAVESLADRPAGFGRGETALHTGKIRKALKAAMPTIADGLERLCAQQFDGYRDRLRPAGAPVHGKAA